MLLSLAKRASYCNFQYSFIKTSNKSRNGLQTTALWTCMTSSASLPPTSQCMMKVRSPANFWSFSSRPWWIMLCKLRLIKPSTWLKSSPGWAPATLWRCLTESLDQTSTTSLRTEFTKRSWLSQRRQRQRSGPRLPVCSCALSLKTLTSSCPCSWLTCARSFLILRIAQKSSRQRALSSFRASASMDSSWTKLAPWTN